MTKAAQLVPARRLEAITGVLALVAGLIDTGVQLFAPLLTVHVTGAGGNYIRQESRWEVFGGFVFSRLGLAALGLCLLCVLAIRYGAYAYGVSHAAHGRLLLWCGAALLALLIVLSMTVLSPGSYFPVTLVAPYLLPSLVLASLASGAAAT
jgi:hypothetical protein